MKSCLLHTPFCLLFATVVLTGGNVLAQSTRSAVNNGVDLYDKGKFVDSEVEFKKGLEKSPDNFQANFNLGDSYYKEGKYEDALKNYSAALSKATMDNQKAAVYHNTGNALLKDQKIKESIGAYEDALKLNPNDVATKYNLSYALDLLKNQNQQNKNNQSQNDKNKNDQNKQPQNQNQQNAPNEISKDQAQAIFNALNNDEKNLQKQLRKMKGEPIKTDKDW